MRAKDLKITYSKLIEQRDKLSSKRGWIDKRLTELTDPKVITDLSDEGLLTDDRIRDIDKQVNQLEVGYRFLKTDRRL